MSIPSDSPWRGCAAYFRQPVSENDELAAQHLSEAVYDFNCRSSNPPLADIIYRSSDGERDILRHVFRWDTRPYSDIFLNGFEARPQQGTPDEIFYNLDHYVHHGGRPLDSTRPATHAFISTTLNSAWNPTVQSHQTEIEVYRYEIYAPGGILISYTLGDRYQYPAQDEVVFVAGIAPQYIHAAQLFRLNRTGDTRFTRRTRVDDFITLNLNYNPQTHPPRLLDIQRPIFDYLSNGRRVLLKKRFYKPEVNYEVAREKRQVSDDATDWYTDSVANVTYYITAAFRAYATNEAYLFMNNEYVLMNYAPATTDDKVINGPLYVCDGFRSLEGTAFGEYGIDCAFDIDYCNTTETFIFSGNLCAYIDYAPGTTKDKVLKGPLPITTFFPFFKGTVFQSGIDAAFKAKESKEAYLFKSDKYALINFGDPNHPGSGYLIAIRKITEGFYSLRNTIFETGFDAAFASHANEEEAYLFKGDQYVLINYAPGTTDDYIIGGPKPILPNWPSLSDILPRKNRGLDVDDYATQPDRDQDHDEL